MPTKVGVIGAGSWGTSLAKLLSEAGNEVVLWAFEPEVVESINTKHENRLFLSGIGLPERLLATSSLEETTREKEFVVSVVPTHVVRQVISQAAPTVPKDAVLISASKGIENESLMTISQIMGEIFPPEFKGRIQYLSGPSFAREVAQRMPTAVAIAGTDEALAQRAQALFSTDYFRCYTNTDVIGVEIAGALKNVIAIAVGINDGLGLGLDARAALITRGLAEIGRLGVHLGAQPITFAGLAGIGDLVLTCTGDLSRNRTVGMKLGKGMKLKDILAEMRMVAEGVKTTRSAYDLSKKLAIEMPITEQTYRILYEDRPPRESVIELMRRPLKSEKERRGGP